jgi:hypothetical protein
MPFLSELWIDLCVKRMIICFFMKAIIYFRIADSLWCIRSNINSWISTETYTSDLVTAEPEVNTRSSRRDPIMTLSETPSKEQHENGTTYQTRCLICTCLSVRNFENAINKSYTYVQPHCIVFFFQCRTGVVPKYLRFCS